MRPTDSGSPSTPAPTPLERRGSTRAGYGCAATVEVRTHTFTCHGIDLAEGGMRVHGAWWSEPGTGARVRFYLRDTLVDVQGRVVWRRRAERGAQSGLAFTSMAPAARALIRAYVEEHAAPADDPWPETGTVVRAPSWDNPPTSETGPETSSPETLDTLAGPRDEPADPTPPAEPREPAEPPRAQPARRSRVRHHVTAEDLWLMQIRNWGKLPEE